MPQYFADIKETEFFLMDAESHHATAVARHKEGDEIRVFDGTGRQYMARIDRVQKKFVRGTLLKPCKVRRPELELELCFAPNSRTGLEDVLDKGTQLGVAAFRPQELCRQLRHAGAKSDASRGCGVHIHIGAQGHTPQSLRNLANIMASHESLIAEALKLDRGRMNRYCRTVDPRFLEQVNRRKPRTMSQLADIWYNSNGASYGRNHHYNDSRYHMLNLHATFTKGTVEFRLFQFDEPTAERRGGIHAGQLKSYIQLCLALSQMAKDVRTASPKPQQNENPKYAMRTWLLRLGFIGEEFATARDFLTRNLTGDTAFRHGRAAA